MNPSIDRIKDLINNNKELIFAISVGKNYSLTPSIVVTANEKRAGIKSFEKALFDIEKYKPDYLIVDLYKQTPSGNHSKKPFVIEKIQLKEIKNSDSLGLGGLGGLGDLGTIIEEKTRLSITTAENNRLSIDNKKLNEEIIEFKKDKRVLENENRTLNDKIKILEWDIKSTEREHKYEVTDIKRNSNKLDKYVELGINILADKIGEDNIRGLLGIGTKEQTEQTKQNAEVEIVEESETKLNAKTTADSINNSLISIIENTNDEYLPKIMKNIVEIYNFCMQNTDNLDIVHNFYLKNKDENNKDEKE